MTTAPEFPTYSEFMLPVLRAVEELGGSAGSGEIIDQVIASEGYTDELLAVSYPTREKSVLIDRLEWARSYCKLGGMLENLLASCPSVEVIVEPAEVSFFTSTPTTPTLPLTCHPDYYPCIPWLDGDALNCGDLDSADKPVTVLVPGVDPYNLDGDNDGIGCESG